MINYWRIFFLTVPSKSDCFRTLCRSEGCRVITFDSASKWVTSVQSSRTVGYEILFKILWNNSISNISNKWLIYVGKVNFILIPFIIFKLGLAIASTLVSLGSYSSNRKNNVSESREMPRSLPKAKTPPTLSQLPWNNDLWISYFSTILISVYNGYF